MPQRDPYDGPDGLTKSSQSECSQTTSRSFRGLLWRILGVARFGGSWGLLVCAILRGQFLFGEQSDIFQPSHLQNNATTSIPKNPPKRKYLTLSRTEHVKKCSATSSPFPGLLYGHHNEQPLKSAQTDRSKRGPIVAPEGPMRAPRASKRGR